MKNPLTALMPAMALLALGGCASTSGLATSEDDGVYYSSKDRTTAIASVPYAAAPANSADDANPDYNGSQARPQASQGRNSGSDQYYDNTYTYMKGVPTSPGLNYYAPYSPYTSLSYGGGYGYGGGFGGYSPYAFGGYDPFYSPFYSPVYSPFGYGYRSGISVSIGFGYGRYSPFGYGYSPFGYGYGGAGFYDPFYSPFYYGGPMYGGYYGRGGYYGNNYGGGYGGGGYYGGNGGYGYGGSSSYDNNGGRSRTSGHRNDRSSEGRVSSGGVSGGNTGAPVPAGGGRGRSELVVQPGTVQATDGVLIDRGRGRTDAGTTAPGTAMEQTNGGYNRPQRLDRSEKQPYRTLDQPVGAGRPQDISPVPDQTSRDDSRGRWRKTDVGAQPSQIQPAATPQMQDGGDRRRGGYFRNTPTDQPANAGTQVSEQPQRQTYEKQQRAYEQPRQRTYEQPRQRAYEQPQQRTYEQPQPQQTYSQPSYSAPSGGGGGGGGRRGRD